jgi:hypothetical protein
MKNYFFLLLLAASGAIAQINFEPGYIINNQHQKTSCFIRNADWNDNPSSIDYKLSETAVSQQAQIADLEEFGIGETAFKRFTVNIDQSSNNSDNLSQSKQPDWEQKTVWLKKLSEGKLSLYQYNSKNMTRFFISASPHATAEQLVYKQYLAAGNTVSENNYYRQQLFTSMGTQLISQSEFEKVAYGQKELVSLFNKYNGVTNNAAESKNSNKTIYALKIIAGANQAKMNASYNYQFTNVNKDFSPKTLAVVGLEFEVVLPVNRNKWSVFIAPYFQTYKNDVKADPTSTLSVKYNSIDIPIGIRHYMYINNTYRFFIDVAYVQSVAKSSKITLENTAAPYTVPTANIDHNSGFNIGAGFGTSRMGIEFRYYKSSEIIDSSYWSAHLSSIGLAINYRFL